MPTWSKLFVALSLLLAFTRLPAQDIPRLLVSENKHYLVTETGEPFFWLGDTAWELFHRLNRDETEMYLENRRQKRFTVIQAVALAEFDGLHTPNFYGDRPLLEDDPARPDTTTGTDFSDSQQYDYWDHVEWVIDLAAEKGLFIGLLPTWGDKVLQKWGVGPVIFSEQTAAVYGHWIGARFRDKKNLVWILGGDRYAEDEGVDYKPIWRAMAMAIKTEDPNHLMTYHPGGAASSSRWFQSDDWFDFSMSQSSHGSKSITNYTYIQADYKLTPTKPTLDGEPAYEDHPVNWNPANGWFADLDVRRGAYCAMFAGAFGHTYGCHDIWQFYTAERTPVSSARTDWREAIDLPGAFDMTIMRHLLESRPMLERIPDQTLVDRKKYGSGPTRIQAMRSNDYALIYFATGASVTLNLGILSGETLNTWWFNPSTGDTLIGERIANSGTWLATAPDVANDWVLVLEDANVYYTAVRSHEENFPAEFVLYGNYPNPFNGCTRIHYAISAPAHVELAIYDLRGRLVRTVVNSFQTAGRHTVDVDGGDLGSGCYIYRVRATGQARVGKMVVVK